MSSLIRIGLKNFTRAVLFAKNDAKIVRTITSKLARGDEPMAPKPAPYNYEEKSFTLLNYLTDKTSHRMDKNSKIIVVEGPLAAGKTKFAKQLAEDLDMLYFPEANLDMIYINSYGFDLRTLDDQLPESCRSYDVNNFMVTPKHLNTAAFQIMQYQVRYSQYIDALAHLLSTGQGVVLDRCCYSDFVFAEAMASSGYISKAAKKAYYDYRANTIGELLRPHLVIYLDVPVNQVIENVRKRGISYERNSPVLNPQYLGVLEKTYKQAYLKEISKHAELLVYDWSEDGDPEVVVEDVERVQFEFDQQSPKMKDWDLKQEEAWALLRYTYADNKLKLMSYFNVPTFNVPELVIDADDSNTQREVMNNAPGGEYDVGFNAVMGDENIYFKWPKKNNGILPRRERRAPPQ